MGRVLAGLLATGLLAVLLAGVPYGLWHWIGWPLPNYVPTVTQIKDTLTGPFTDQILLDTLACLCWLIWAVFLTDVARAAPGALHNARPAHTAAVPRGMNPRPRPLRGLATLLLATIAAGLLSLRPHPVWATRNAAPVTDARPDIVAAATLPTDRAPVPVTAASVPGGVRTAVVQSQHDGIHDSLWRIAERYLGDGARWPEIYQLNKGHPQPDGGTLSSPSLIQPGWILRLPAQVSAGTAGTNAPGDAPPPTTAHTPRPPIPGPDSSAPHPSAAPSAPTGVSSSPTTPEPPAGNQESDASTHPAGTGQWHSSGGLDLGDGVFVSLGLAGAISAAVVAERRRRRRRYLPGSGRRDDLLPIAPVVRSLHLAHLRATGPAAPSDDDTDADEPGEGERNNGQGSSGPDTDDPHSQMPIRTNAVQIPPTTVAQSAGGRDPATAIAQAVMLAVTGGLGLAGPGAENVLRGLVLEFLSRPPNLVAVPLHVAAEGASGSGSCEVVMTAATAARLMGRTTEAGGPARLHITPDLGAALDQLEAITLHRARLHHDHAEHDWPAPEQSPVLLITEVPPDSGRLQAVLDNGAALGVGGVLLGQWRPGSSLYTTPDGQVTATSPGPGRRLHRGRLPTLTAATAHDLLNTLRPPPDPAPSPARAHPVGKDAGRAAAGHPKMADGYDRNRTAASMSPGTALATGLPIAGSKNAAPGAALAGPGIAGAPHEVTPDRGGHGRLLLRVLGPIQLSRHTDSHPAAGHSGQHPGQVAGRPDTVPLGPRQRELLLLLALHPNGITRDRLADTLWPDTPPGRPFNALHTTLNRLRRNLASAGGSVPTEITRTDGDRYQLDPRIVTTDYQQLRAALAARRAATDDEARARACRAVLAAYTGELGEGVAADWVETPREATRRDVLDAAVTLARHTSMTDPQEALDVLETARNLDPYNEQLYRDIMRLQQRLGRASSISHTLTLLTNRLAEIEQTPEPATITLAQRLITPAPAHRDPTTQPTTQSTGTAAGSPRPS
ncbi:MAG: BTAD domain-containing putative transcriptional regulator [Jatrophihabitantaceae bacterium]